MDEEAPVTTSGAGIEPKAPYNEVQDNVVSENGGSSSMEVTSSVDDAVSPAAVSSLKSERRSATPEPARKRRKVDPAQDMQTLYDFMRKYKREDGSELCEMFVRAPKRRNDPQYYEVVSDPIDMLRIQQKLKTEEYASMENLKEDFEKLFSNALAYYKKGTSEFKDATEMKSLFDKALALVESGEDPVATLGDREENSEEELLEMLEDMFASIITATDSSDANRLLHFAFRLLPSKNRYPEYYKVITEPIDLKMIALKITDSEYRSLSELEDDLNLLCRNAQLFNEPGSQIYKDSRALTRIVKSKKQELEANKVARENRGSRSTRRLQVNKKHHVTEIANLTYEDSESEESSEDEYDTEDPLWALYHHVRHYKSPAGICYAEPFLQLPSKREFADYYLTIGDPISLNEIKKKLKNQEYGDTLSSLYEDLDLMFENCKEYNRPDSRLFKDGSKLQRIMKAKYDELSGSDNEASDDDDEDSDEDEEDSKALPQTPATPGLKKNLRALYNSIYRYRNSDGIQLIGLFVEKPSKKDYPDYYNVISNPMDMKTIDEKIKNQVYRSVDEMIADCRLMFANCRLYNEEGSEIYEDANKLERVLNAKLRELGFSGGLIPRKPATGGKRVLAGRPLQDKMKQLIEKIRDYKDKGRQLSIIFLRLPNPKEFPDYYQVIKKPIDFERINAKVKQAVYRSMDECLADFVLMFDNACKYNEPDSQICKDALILQSLAQKECRNLMEDEDDAAVPDVNACVQEILSTIFVSMYNHKDAEERCFSDSLAELPEHDIIDGKKTRVLNLDLIKRRLDRGLYKRLDHFQKDIFIVLERARNLSRSDSQIFEDSGELQRHFIQIRDDSCQHGEILQSRALLYTQAHLTKAIDDLRNKKQLEELPEEGGEEPVKNDAVEGEGSAMFNQQQYHVGDFVYTSAGDEKKDEKKIFLIEKIFRGPTGAQMMSGNRFFKPVETFHISTRKFLAREVFRTDVREDFEFDRIVGRCAVLSVHQYFKMAPAGFAEDDVFVCESRYNSKARSFKKMKLFWTHPDHIQLVNRPKPIEPQRVMSIFKQRIEKHKEEIEELEALEKAIDETIPPNVVWETSENVTVGGEGCVYYEQYTIPGPITLRRGDAVYVRAENGKNLIAQIDTMWTNPNDNMAYFHGPWFVTPSETPTTPNQLFFKQEAFISTIQDSNPLLSVVGKCCVLEVEEYKGQRPTQYDESDVYICESVYDESRRQIRPLPTTGLKTYEHGSTDVIADEVYYFKRKIVVVKDTTATGAVLQQPQLPQTPTMTPMEVDNEDSLDAPPSVSSVEASQNIMSTPSLTPTTPAATPSGKKVKERKKPVTPYILYASMVRKQTAEQYKGRGFGEISKIVGDQWRAMSDAEKAIYEEKCKKINKEHAAKIAEEKRLAEERRKQEVLDSAARAMSATPPAGATTITLPQQPVSNTQLLTRTPLSPNSQQMAQNIIGAGAPQKQIEPIFHTVPPRPQRLLHSEAYIRYIEGLTAESSTMCNWDKQLNSCKENTRTDEAKLPAHWLADNGDHGTSLDALWALRDFLVQDSLGVVKLSYQDL